MDYSKLKDNEITVLVKCSKNDLIKKIELNNFKIIKSFYLDDIYLIPNTININYVDTREILKDAVLVRRLKYPDKEDRFLTYKIKNIDENGNILNQRVINCSINSYEQATNFMLAIGYRRILEIQENDLIYSNGDLEFTIKDIINGDLLLEFKTDKNNNNLQTIIDKINYYKLPIDTSNYFYKKAESELNRLLGRD